MVLVYRLHCSLMRQNHIIDFFNVHVLTWRQMHGNLLPSNLPQQLGRHSETTDDVFAWDTTGWSIIDVQLSPIVKGAYLQNGEVDFAHFWQANQYGRAYLIIEKSSPSDQYLSF